jgi:uncharacterized protein (DUF1330 family)
MDKERSMPKAYWVVTYRSVTNPDAWQAYAKLAGPALQGAGGRFLIRNKPAKTYESGLNERVVLVEFDSLDQAIAAHETPAYKKALEALGTGNVERDLRIVEGA